MFVGVVKDFWIHWTLDIVKAMALNCEISQVEMSCMIAVRHETHQPDLKSAFGLESAGYYFGITRNE